MSDRELLELAAKAADIFLTPESLARAFPKWKWDKYFELRHEGDIGVSGAVLVYDYDGKLSGTTREAWNPLTDDGDALRLMVKLGIDFKIRNGVTWWDHHESDGVVYWGYEQHNGDPLAATRRAIVRAAAEIGRGMK